MRDPAIPGGTFIMRRQRECEVEQIDIFDIPYIHKMSPLSRLSKGKA
jgi:hypothetical protein